jgi:hypothetical protein
MPDDQNTHQNLTPEENPSPTSPQEPTEQGSENTVHFDSLEATQEPQEAQGEAFEPKVINEHLLEIPLESRGPQTDSVSNETSQNDQTAQTPVNEPLRKTSLARELLITARNAIQFRKSKKLDKIMSLFLQQSKITNDEVEKLLHVSDATATRYLSQLEKEGKIKQSGKTGKGVSYSRI